MSSRFNLLSKETVESAKIEWRNIKKQSKGVQLSRLKGSFRETLQGLATVANCESVKEKQLRGMLNPETLRPFVKAILHPKAGIWPPPAEKMKEYSNDYTAWYERLDKKSQREWEQRRKRIQSICAMLIQECYFVTGAIAPKAKSVLVDIHSTRPRQMDEDSLRALLVGY